MPAELCPTCGLALSWDDQDYEWVCYGCGDVFTDEDLAEIGKGG